MKALRRRLARLAEPFRVRVYTFEHTRIRVRSFPPLFAHERIESLQDRLTAKAAAGGGVVYLEAGQHILYEQVEIAGRIIGEGADKTVLEYRES